VAVAPATTSATIENRQEIIAAVTAACAEEMGTDISALRVISFKKL
jgi:phenylpyruvate tautomerase PptA (4-oxalocrotonate tautomerase family)